MISRLRGRGQPQDHKEQSATQVLPETVWAANDTMPSGTPPEDTVVVTISRLFGSGGDEVAHLLAQQSNLHYVDRQVIDEAAQQLNTEAPEAMNQNVPPSDLAGHILGAVQVSNPFVANYSSPLGQASALTQWKELAYFQLTQRLILEQATQGNAVVVGRGSQFLLHNAPRTLHIYIFAPLPYRIEAVMKRFDLDHNRAKQLIEQRDYEHDSYLRRYYGSDGHQPGLYHLLINTGLFSLDLAADFIKQALPVVKAIHS
ncbi:MAG: cytidylate kinase-like family protein [Ktedonobacteraceae bacterium]|nr:cytidylate kinase-like family protein [Ktedonobacteraceae bacterium]MBV9616583.1 cytidylate kinase-like family protein [Ktedonobacteraceae bacterium]MBV9711762.1 cytidylate kinase-like family protein [Ktedonobacteraceae bacterium]